MPGIGSPWGQVLSAGRGLLSEKDVAIAYRELGMVEIREVVRRFTLGDGIRAIARGTWVDRA